MTGVLNRLFRLTIRLFLMVLLLFLARTPIAQGPPIPPQVECIAPPEPFDYSYGSPPIVIQGTKFPWYDRLNNFVTTLGQRFRVYNASSVAGITVLLNGRACLIDGTDPNNAHYKYMDANNPVNAGPDPVRVTYTVEFKYNGVRMKRTDGSDAYYTNTFDVYKVEPIPHTGSYDTVNATSSCTFDGAQGADTGTLWAAPTTTVSRGLKAWFQVTPTPQDVINGQARYGGIVVGIIQTVTEQSVLPTTQYTCVTPNNNLTGHIGTLSLTPSENFPWWDGLSGVNADPCYYSTAARTYGPNQGGTTWVGGPLLLQDRPGQGLGLIQVSNYPGLDWHWGTKTITGSVTTWTLSGTAMHDDFEDMLSASSNGCPFIVVPINGYKCWSVDLAGALTIANGASAWSGGGTNQGAITTFNKPVTVLNRGSANDLTANAAKSFVVP